MMFLTVLIVYLFVQLSGSGRPLHHDSWFSVWAVRVSSQGWLKRPGASLSATLLVPVIVVIVIYGTVTSLWSWLGLLVTVPVLIYCLGRGEYTQCVDEYLNGLLQEDWSQSLESYYALVADGERAEIKEGDWSALHDAMMNVVAYRGFERLFAVLFWFILLGPAGALVYRLTHLYIVDCESSEDVDIAKKWLWIIEWPAARVLGLSLALTGNFTGCFAAWRECLFCAKRTTPSVLDHYMRGALGIESDAEQSIAMTHRELRSVLALYYRTWVFWMCLLAVITLVI
ncbi:membrane protein [Aurantivibrio plasticivorans]